MNDDSSLQALIAEMEAACDGRVLAVPRLLLASVAEARGDMKAYRDALEGVLSAEPQNEEALADLADLYAVAGDAREADRLYRLAGLPPDSDEITFLRPFLQPPADGPGRNRPCPCGSGKKYKLCHGRTAVHPLERRASWLWAKVQMFAQRSPQRTDVLTWGGLVAGAAPDSADAAREALSNPMVLDLAIGDGGLLEKFLTVMGGLLPSDELTLAEQWADQPVRLLELRQVLPMRGVQAIDLLTRDELVILDRRLTRDIAERDVLLGRPLDDGAGDLRFQSPPVRVPRMMRARLLELLRSGGGSQQLAAALAPTQPTVHTTDGQELVVCTARYQVTDLDDTWQQLTVRLDADPDNDVMHRLSEDDTVLGTIRRKGQRLVLETNAVERLRALQSILAEVEPRARLVDESTTPWDRADVPAPSPTADDELQLSADEIAGIQRVLEDRWLDAEIPALGGQTPREAARTSRRDDLTALLDDFEWQQRHAPSPVAMDVPRLREELGLEG